MFGAKVNIKSLGKLPARIAGSTVVMLIACLILVDAGLKISEAGAKRLNDDDRLVTARQFFAGHEKPEMVILGSSLAGSAHCAYRGQYTPTNSCPTGRPYLQYLLTEKLGRAVSLINLAWSASMPVDAVILYNKLVEHDKVPKLIVYELGPRELMDNLIPQVGVIGDPTTLEELHPGFLSEANLARDSFLGRAAQAIDQSKLSIEFRRRLARLGQKPSPDAVRDLYIGLVWHYYQARAEIKAKLVDFARDQSGREATLYAASRRAEIAKTSPKVVTTPKKSTPLDDQLADYSKRYNPPNDAQIKFQRSKLEELGRLCKEHGTGLVIVNMPIAQTNRALLGKDRYDEYKSWLSSIAKKTDCKYLDLNDDSIYKGDDFLDSLHLSYQGNMKFQNILLQAIADSDFQALVAAKTH